MVRPLTEFALKDGISKQGRPTPQPFPPSPSPSTDSFVNHVELKSKIISRAASGSTIYTVLYNILWQYSKLQIIPQIKFSEKVSVQ